jgi:hypothetical protein
MFETAAYLSALAAIAVSVFMAWRLSRSGRLSELPPWRRGLLQLGLIGNTASLILLLAVLFQMILKSEREVANFELLSRVSIPFTVAPVILGAFGKRVPRVLVILNGLVLTFFWLDLAASSL